MVILNDGETTLTISYKIRILDSKAESTLLSRFFSTHYLLPGLRIIIIMIIPDMRQNLDIPIDSGAVFEFFYAFRRNHFGKITC